MSNLGDSEVMHCPRSAMTIVRLHVVTLLWSPFGHLAILVGRFRARDEQISFPNNHLGSFASEEDGLAPVVCMENTDHAVGPVVMVEVSNVLRQALWADSEEPRYASADLFHTRKRHAYPYRS